jgi:S-adenosylmethionine:tRNA ribosyltransferase-isomerase
MTPGDFHFSLPLDLIAQEPLPERAASRLLHLRPHGEGLADLRFTDLSNIVQSGDLLVVNDTRVVPARLCGSKATGGRVEMLLERTLEADVALVQLKASRAPAAGARLEFEGGISATVDGREDGFFRLRFDTDIHQALTDHGHVPLPPYIRRPDRPADRERYQTVFAAHAGAVAAPTAGLHFDRGQLNRLRSRGVDIAALTLHVGAGTFQPLRAEQLERQRLHREQVEVSAQLCSSVESVRRRGGRVVAVGTTVIRALETAAAGGELRPFSGETELFIYPGFQFRVADALLTNFHLPESSLLMLVCAFAGTEAVLSAYRHAIRERYRFFSYGDAMFCHRSSELSAVG